MTKLDINRLFAENIEKDRYELGLSQKQMAKELELSLSAYKRLISQNTEKIDIYTLYKLYQLTGKTAYDYLDITDDCLNMRRRLQELSEGQTAFIDAVIEFERLFKETIENADDYITVLIPTGNMEDGMVYDSCDVQKMSIGSYNAKYGNTINCGIKITSNHLHPVYNLGDIILVSKRPIRDGDTGIFVNKENRRAYVRKFHQTEPCVLEPINEYGETFFVDSHNKADMDKWIKFGVVISKIR